MGDSERNDYNADGMPKDNYGQNPSGMPENNYGQNPSGMPENNYGYNPSGMPENNYGQNPNDAYGQTDYGNSTWNQASGYTSNDNMNMGNPHPVYYNGVPLEEPAPKEGHALEICSLVFGILSLCGCCYGLFAIIGLVCAIVALAKGKKSGLSIAGLICSILGVLVTIGVFVFWTSDSGKEVIEEFQKDFAQGYESEIEDDDTTDVVEDTDSSTQSSATKSTATNTGADYQTLSLDGTTITIPCTVSEIEKNFEIAEEDMDLLEDCLTANGSEYIALAKDGTTWGVNLYVENLTEETKDTGKLVVTGIWIEESMGDIPDMQMFGGLLLGMSEDDVTAVMSGYDVETDTYDTTTEYMYKMDEDYVITVVIDDGTVEELDVDYYGDYE